MFTLHTPKVRYESVFSTTPQSVPAVRHQARTILTQWMPGITEGSLDRALLIVGELVANAVKHAARLSPRAELSLETADHQLIISVHDRDPHHPQALSAASPDGTGGRGMRIVYDLASEVGGIVEVHSDADLGGKLVRVCVPL
ncbi:ATP-binding protein [Streptomyces sp. NPDC051644]